PVATVRPGLGSCPAPVVAPLRRAGPDDRRYFCPLLWRQPRRGRHLDHVSHRLAPHRLRPGTFGKVDRVVAGNSLVVSTTEHARGLVTPPHAHELASINLVTDGLYAEQATGATGVHAPGTLIYKPAGETHSNAFRDAGARCVLVEFDPA